MASENAADTARAAAEQYANELKTWFESQRS
jgi:hypothetical protein